jgi:hypothetical protein
MISSWVVGTLALAPSASAAVGGQDPEAGRPLPDIEDGPVASPEPARERPIAVPLAPRSRDASVEPSAEVEAPPPRVEVGEDPISVALALAPESPGTPEERSVLDALRLSVPQGATPPRNAQVLADGSDSGRRSCRKGGYDLIVAVGHLPDRNEPVLVPYDCALERPLGVRGAAAASDPALVGVLWEEHRELVARGVKEKGPGLTRKARTGLIAAGASLLIAGAVTAILLGVLRDETTVLKVEPE